MRNALTSRYGFFLNLFQYPILRANAIVFNARYFSSSRDRKTLLMLVK